MYRITDTNVDICSTIISTTMFNIVITSLKIHRRKKISFYAAFNYWVMFIVENLANYFFMTQTPRNNVKKNTLKENKLLYEYLFYLKNILRFNTTFPDCCFF